MDGTRWNVREDIFAIPKHRSHVRIVTKEHYPKFQKSTESSRKWFRVGGVPPHSCSSHTHNNFAL